jgi:hypothetical protein
VVDSGAIDLIVPVHPRLQRLMPNPDNPNLAGFIVKSAQRRPRIVTSPAMAVDRLRGWR